MLVLKYYKKEILSSFRRIFQIRKFRDFNLILYNYDDFLKGRERY